MNYAPKPIVIFEEHTEQNLASRPPPWRNIKGNEHPSMHALKNFFKEGKGILFLSDLHLGVNDPKYIENNRRFITLVSELANLSEKGPPIRIFVTGDIFDGRVVFDKDPQQNEEMKIKNTANAFKLLCRNKRVQLEILGGNHDVVRLEGKRTVDLLAVIDGKAETRVVNVVFKKGGKINEEETRESLKNHPKPGYVLSAMNTTK